MIESYDENMTQLVKLNSFIGSDYPDEPSFIGFLWYFVIVQNELIVDYISIGTSNICLSTDTCSCNISMKIDSDIGCVSIIQDVTVRSIGNKCDKSKCLGGLLPECNCSSLVCEFDVKNECKCLESDINYSFNDICYSKLSSCNNGCSSCEGNNLCTGCVEKNAFIGTDKKCHCNQGFFGPVTLSDIDSCTPCNQGCSECDEYNICIKCFDQNSEIIDKNCICKKGYYENKDLPISNKCLKCNEGCSLCDSKNNCTSCFDSNAEIIESKCFCKAGFYGISPLSDTDHCTKCNPGCSKCNYENTCIECFDKNVVVRDKNCVCKVGYSEGNNADCIKCPENCLKCTNSKFCDSCNLTNYNYSNGCYCIDDDSLNSSNGSCVDCFEFCFSCINYPESSECVDNYESRINICKCHEWCFNSDTCKCKNCDLCLKNCIDCNFSNNYNICMDCKEGYILDNGKCKIECGSNNIFKKKNVFVIQHS